MRIITDIFGFCMNQPWWNTISSGTGYPREGAKHRLQEIAFNVRTVSFHVDAAIVGGLDDEFAPAVSLSFNAHNNL